MRCAGCARVRSLRIIDEFPQIIDFDEQIFLTVDCSHQIERNIFACREIGKSVGLPYVQQPVFVGVLYRETGGYSAKGNAIERSFVVTQRRRYRCSARRNKGTHVISEIVPGISRASVERTIS